VSSEKDKEIKLGNAEKQKNAKKSENCSRIEVEIGLLESEMMKISK